MSTVSHTPGPWAVHPMRARVVPADHIARPIGGAADPQIDLETYAQEICALHHPDPHRPVGETRANARLIAAAPDLLAALKLAYPILLVADDHSVPRFAERLNAVEAALQMVEALP